jgi:hypothetical protein
MTADTSSYKFAAGSLEYTSTTSHLNMSDSDDWDFGTGDFTIDFWFKVPASDHQLIMTDGGETDWVMCYFQPGAIKCRIEASTTITGSATLTTGTWYHIALVRDSGTLDIYVDGVSKYSGTQSADIDNGTNDIVIGRSSSSPFLGTVTTARIDEFRIVKGAAIWTSNFTAPSAAYTECGAAFLPKMEII